MSTGIHFTTHARERCRERGIDPEAVLSALASGRARVSASDALSVTWAFRKLRIVCSTDDGSIVTVYRDPGVKRRLKKRRQNERRQRLDFLHAKKC